MKKKMLHKKMKLVMFNIIMTVIHKITFLIIVVYELHIWEKIKNPLTEEWF